MTFILSINLGQKDKELILEPYEKQNFRSSGFGFSARFEEKENVLLIKSIYKGQQADKLGIHPGDIIHSINGQTMEAEHHHCNFSYKNLDQVILEIEQGGVARQVTLKREDYFPVGVAEVFSENN